MDFILTLSYFTPKASPGNVEVDQVSGDTESAVVSTSMNKRKKSGFNKAKKGNKVLI